MDDVTTALAATDGVSSASPAIVNDAEPPTAVMWRVFPTTSPQDAATTDLVEQLRSDVLPSATDGTGLDVAVTGTVAANIDFSDYLAERLPYFFAAVLALSFLLLMAVFRSILVPLKAVVMNLLGIGAAYGIMIAGFQWGWLGPVLGIDGGPIEPFLPMMLFAIVFGLSMDYEVFLLSRIKEEWDRTGDSHASVANGLAATARVITAAAAIMVVVFGAFMLGDDRVIKMAGLGLATAVFLDATIVRMLLVPATMELLGDRNWWLPGWLDRILPSIDVEGHGAAGPASDDRVSANDNEPPTELDDDRELEPV
jgi:RND superfamily putative drug exporter